MDVALPGKGVVYGEISLSGDVRPVGRSEARLKEAAKLGFDSAIAPQAAADGNAPVRVLGVATALELVQTLRALAGE
jgi:DNA repair protein RadA/Sms